MRVKLRGFFWHAAPEPVARLMSTSCVKDVSRIVLASVVEEKGGVAVAGPDLAHYCEIYILMYVHTNTAFW